MSTKEVVSIFFDTVNKRDFDALEAILTDHAQFYFPKARPFVNKGQIIRFFKILFRQFPELTFQIQRTIIQDQMAAVHWKNHGVNRNQESYNNEGVTWLEMEGGNIKLINDFFKDTEKF